MKNGEGQLFMTMGLVRFLVIEIFMRILERMRLSNCMEQSGFILLGQNQRLCIMNLRLIAER